MNKPIYLCTDDHFINTEDHEVIKEVLISGNYPVEDDRADTGAKGGPVWFARDLILSIPSEIIGGFFGAIGTIGLEKLIKVFRKIKAERKETAINICVNINLEKPIEVYYILNTYDYSENVDFNTERDLKKAVNSIPKKQEEIEKLFINEETQKILGHPDMIKMQYDFYDANWVMTELISPTSTDFEP